MAIERAIRMYQIKNLKLGTDGRGMYLSLVCPAADGYCLCFTKGAPVTREELNDLTEEELRELLQGREIAKGRYRLQGVRANVFHANPSFRNFKAAAPEQIQIWSLSYKQLANEAVLHFPDDPESQLTFIPMRYRWSVRRDNGFVILNVELLDNGEYESGVLMYRVGNTLPIPIPEAKIGKNIRLRVPANEEVRVIVNEEYQGKYLQA